MNAVATSIRIDPEIKSAAQILAKRLGTNLSTVVNIYLSQFVREKRLNVSVDEEGFSRDESARIQSDLNMKNNPVVAEFENPENFLRHLEDVRKNGLAGK